MKRGLILTLVLGALAVGGVVALKLRPQKTDLSGLLTAPVARGDVEETVLATGTFKPYRLVAVGSQVSGRITAVHVAVGDVLRKGDLVAEIDSTTQANNLRTAEASLANVRAQRREAEATLKNAELALARQQALVAGNSGKTSDLEGAEATRDQTVAQLAALDAQIVSAEVAVETARANLGYTRITAPMDGTVLAVVNQEGQTVNATQSAPTIVILGQLDRMIVRAEISEADVVRVRPGQPVYFTILGDPAGRHDTVLQAIEPAPESVTSDRDVTSSSSSSSSSTSSSAVYYNGILTVDNPDRRFRTYMTAEVHVVLGAARGVVTVPASALLDPARSGANRVKRLAGDGAVTIQAVVIGLNDGVKAEVLSGVGEGDTLVLGEAATGTGTTSRRAGPPPMGP